jgi:hypothetical protein
MLPIFSLDWKEVWFKNGTKKESAFIKSIYHKVIAINSSRAQANSLLDGRFPSCTINQHETPIFQLHFKPNKLGYRQWLFLINCVTNPIPMLFGGCHSLTLQS